MGNPEKVPGTTPTPPPALPQPFDLDLNASNSLSPPLAPNESRATSSRRPIHARIPHPRLPPRPFAVRKSPTHSLRRPLSPNDSLTHFVPRPIAHQNRLRNRWRIPIHTRRRVCSSPPSKAPPKNLHPTDHAARPLHKIVYSAESMVYRPQHHANPPNIGS